MSFLLTEDKSEMIVTCNCACGDSIRFKVMSDKDDVVKLRDYLSFVIDNAPDEEDKL